MISDFSYLVKHLHRYTANQQVQDHYPRSILHPTCLQISALAYCYTPSVFPAGTRATSRLTTPSSPAHSILPDHTATHPQCVPSRFQSVIQAHHTLPPAYCLCAGTRPASTVTSPSFQILFQSLPYCYTHTVCPQQVLHFVQLGLGCV